MIASSASETAAADGGRFRASFCISRSTSALSHPSLSLRFAGRRGAGSWMCFMTSAIGVAAVKGGSPQVAS